MPPPPTHTHHLSPRHPPSESYIRGFNPVLFIQLLNGIFKLLSVPAHVAVFSPCRCVPAQVESSSTSAISGIDYVQCTYKSAVTKLSFKFLFQTRSQHQFINTEFVIMLMSENSNCPTILILPLQVLFCRIR